MRLKKLLFATALACLATPLSSYALQSLGPVNIVVSSSSTAEAWAGYNMVRVTGVSLLPVCNNALYIAPEDKHMFAEALTAQVNGLPVSLYYDENNTSRNLAVTTSPCKIVWLSRE